MPNQLYEFRMKVSPGNGCDLPQGMKGAYVPCYAAASDFQAAVKKGVAAITRMHFLFDDLDGRVREIPLDRWSEYVSRVWPEYVSRFPKQVELPQLVESGTIFFGPFACY